MPIASGLDFASVLAFAERMGALSDLFADLLPEIEGIIVRSYMRNDSS